MEGSETPSATMPDDWPKSRTFDELRTLALDIVGGKVFIDGMIREGDFEHVVQSVFMPLAFMPREQRERMKNVGMAYEYLSEAGPRSINGYPMFMSMHALTKFDALEVYKMVQNMTNAMNEAVPASTPT